MQMLSIIVPTYREAPNIAPLCEGIHAALAERPYSYEIIIVDDDSGDGIEDTVSELKKRYPVRVFVRKGERGLASAVIKGFELAGGDVLLVMDADLSHPTEKVPDVAAPVFSGEADFCIGSRFVPGGNADHFNLFRRLNAGVSKLLARPFTRANDPMAGFFAFPASILKDAAPLDPIGFKIGLEVIVKAAPQRVAEVPIQFRERLHGESKLSLKEQVNYLRHLLKLLRFKYEALYQFILFAAIGSSGMVVDLSTVFITRECVGFSFRVARVAGVLLAMSTNFLLNRRFTFPDGRKKSMAWQYAAFLVTSMLGFCVNWLISVYLVENIAYFGRGYFYLLAAFIGILGGMVINFIGSRYVVFRR